MELADFIYEISRSKNLDKINTVANHFLNVLQVKSYAFTYYSQYPTSKRKLQYEHSSTPLKAWHEHYIESEYEDVDQTLQRNKTFSVPIFWDVHQQLRNATTSREKRLREESIALGIDKGISIPVHGPSDDFAVLVLHQRKNEACLENYQNNIGIFFALAHYYYHAVKNVLDLSQPLPVHYHISLREQQCLYFTAKEFLARDVAKKLNISERTVHFHMQNINKKLGVKNKFQAVLKAREKGLIAL